MRWLRAGARYMIERLRALLSWRRNLGKLYKAVKAVLPDAKVYIFGGAAEDRLTALSDIDVLVVTDKASKDAFETAKIIVKIKEELEKLGVEQSYLYDIHMVNKEDVNRYLAKTRRIIDVEELLKHNTLL